MVRSALLLVVVASAAPVAAQAPGSSTVVSFAFTGWSGPYATVDKGLDPADPSNWDGSGLINGGRPAKPLRARHPEEAPFRWVVGTMPLLPTDTVTMAFDSPFVGPENIVQFTPTNATNILPGGIFELGRLRFTNGSWYGDEREPSFMGFEMRVASPTPALNTVLRGAFAMVPRIVGGRCDTLAEQIANADAIVLYIDGQGLVDAAYAFDSNCAPAGFTNVASFRLAARFSSVHVVGFQNAGGGFTGTPPDGLPASPPWLGPIPEPATWSLLIAGFGLVGVTARRRRGLATV